MNAPFNNAFQGRSVFVTGHTGFKGSWLCLWLEHLGARVTGYALEPPTDPNNFSISNVQDVLVGHHEDDIRDEATLHAAMQAAQPDVVLHLAAQTVVHESYRIPRETFDVNVMGTATVLEGVRKLDKQCAVVCITSDKCYENREQLWGYRETDAFGDHDPYGGSKGAAEILIRSYRHSFFHPARLEEHGIKLASARAGNVVGGGDWTADALIVDIVKALSAGESVKIRNLVACRPWQHVLQALSGYLTLAARLLQSDDPQFCSGWNIGPLPADQLTVREVVEEFLKEWGTGSWRDESDPNQLHEATLLHLAIDKAMHKLDWRPCWSVYEALRQTAHWYRQYTETDGCMQGCCLEQILAYEAAMTVPHRVVSPASERVESHDPAGATVII
jgi:CDP-glucose 4,6-dehydratase